MLFSTLHKMTSQSTPATFTTPRPPLTITTATDDSHHQRIRHSFAVSETSQRRSSTNNSSNGTALPSSDGDDLTTPPLQTSERSLSLSSTVSLPPPTATSIPALSPSLSSSSTLSVPASETAHVKPHSPLQRNSPDDFLAHTNAILVDDNPVNQKVLARMLSRIGLICQTAQNGQEACDMVRASNEQGKPIDLVFMDIWMPKMNGLEAATVIRNELSLSPYQPYIIAMTACVMPGDRDKCIEAGKYPLLYMYQTLLLTLSVFLGMNAYVSKPVRKQDLEAAIHTFTQTLIPPSPLPSIEEYVDVLEMSSTSVDNDKQLDDFLTTLPTVTITQDDRQ